MAIQPCEAIKKIRDALGAPVTAEALAQRIHEEMCLLQHGTDSYVSESGVQWENVPTNYEVMLRRVALGILKDDAGAEIRAVLDAVNESLPMIYRK